ncbi:MAG: MFS transporter, partial [Woeseia sp.]
GWVVENIGWREALFIVGVPGIFLALLVRFSIKEPARGSSEGRTDTELRPGVMFVARFLLQRKSFIHLAVGSGLAAFGGYAVASFFPSFLVRTHGMNPATVGVYLGLILGIAGGLGFAGGGYVADRLSRKGRRRSLWGVAAATMLGWACSFPVYLVSDPMIALTWFVVPAIFSNFYLATTLAQAQGLVGLRMRGVASALMLFILNIIGLGMGPQVTGIISDLLAPQFGVDSMRYSLLAVVAVASPWSAFHYIMAGRHIDYDLSRAADMEVDHVDYRKWIIITIITIAAVVLVTGSVLWWR